MIETRTSKLRKSFKWIPIKDVKGNGKVIGDEKRISWENDIKRIWNADEEVKSYWERETLNATLSVMKGRHWALRKQESKTTFKGQWI